jgi:hypothetical protein
MRRLRQRAPGHRIRSAADRPNSSLARPPRQQSGHRHRHRRHTDGPNVVSSRSRWQLEVRLRGRRRCRWRALMDMHWGVGTRGARVRKRVRLRLQCARRADVAHCRLMQRPLCVHSASATSGASARGRSRAAEQHTSCSKAQRGQRCAAAGGHWHPDGSAFHKSCTACKLNMCTRQCVSPSRNSQRSSSPVRSGPVHRVQSQSTSMSICRRNRSSCSCSVRRVVSVLGATRKAQTTTPLPPGPSAPQSQS